MVDDHRTYWTTDDEIRFIQGLGRGKWGGRNHNVKTAGREKLLRNYKQSMLNRFEWGKIDKGAVARAVDVELMDYMPI